MSYMDFDHGITAIDTDYLRPLMDASHLMVEGERAAFIDTGTTHSLGRLLGALEQKEIDRDQVDYVLLTHVHLDHAGGAGMLMRSLPRAQLVVHPRGARHMIDPTKLIAGSREVYGDDEFERLYGEIPPVAAERVITAEDGDVIELSGRALEFIHTPGHARHHLCIVDEGSGGIFTGDAFGLSYRELDTERGEFIFPTTTPVQFDPDEMHRSIDRIMDREPRACYLTHYSRVTEVDRLARDLHECIDGFVAIARRHQQAANRSALMSLDLFEFLSHRLDQHGFVGDDDTRHTLLDMDVKLNVRGMEIWMDRD